MTAFLSVRVGGPHRAVEGTRTNQEIGASTIIREGKNYEMVQQHETGDVAHQRVQPYCVDHCRCRHTGDIGTDRHRCKRHGIVRKEHRTDRADGRYPDVLPADQDQHT